MSQKTKHSTNTIPENGITQDALVALVEKICQESINGSVDIRPRLHEVFKQYHESLKDKCFVYDSELPAIDFSTIDNSLIENKIGLILRANLTGQIAESMDLARSLWNDDILINVHTIQPSEQNYYRTRANDTPLKIAREMFHAPFELRGSVKTARYSVLGFPSLYLTKNIYTAWEEARRANIETFYASRLRLQRPIRLVDLRLRRSFSDINKGEREAAVRQYLRTIPLIIACSLKVKKDSDAFKPEYILPQLILHTVIDEMIRRFQKHRDDAKEHKFFDSTLEITDEITDRLLNSYHGDQEKMQEEVNEWSDSYGEEWTKEKAAAKLLRAFLRTKYYRLETTEGVFRMVDADWLHYECNKGIRKFSEESLDGIIYSSTRFDHNYWSKKENVNSDCIVLPVHSLLSKGFCEYLLNAFTITPPVGFKPEFLKKFNNKGSEKKEYQHSYFGLLEQELQKQELQKLSNFYGTPVSRKKEEIEKIFDEQIHALTSLNELYDKGNISIAPFIGIVLRNLFEKFNKEHSLWELKHGKDALFCDSAVEKKPVPQNYTIKSPRDAQGRLSLPNVVITGAAKVYAGLLRKVISENGEYNLYPLLDERKGKTNRKAFEEWYNQVIFAIGDVTFTRKQAIETVAKSEGNISEKLPDNYALFHEPTSLRIQVNGEPVVFNQNPVYVSLRQIAWEVLETINNHDNINLKQ